MFPPPSIARYSFIQLSETGRHGENENVKDSKQQGEFEPRLLDWSSIFSWVHTCMKYNDLVYSVITKTLRVCIWSRSHVQ